LVFKYTVVPLSPISPSSILCEVDDDFVVVNIISAMSEQRNMTNWVRWMLWLYDNDYSIFNTINTGKRITICCETMTYSESNSNFYNTCEKKILYFSVGDKDITVIGADGVPTVKKILFNQLF
jgi:hypothetical protein